MTVTAGAVTSIQVGLPRTVGEEGAADPLDRRWTSAIWKQDVAGPLWCGTTGLAGDAQADLENHGGPDKAVLAYASSHYPAWRVELERPEMEPGGFGENLTVAGLDEGAVCIGDTVAVGGALLQLSQPRGPCWKLARRWRVRELAALAQRTGRTGWYYRVLREGELCAGQPLVLVDRPFPEWTVSRANEVMYERRGDVPATLALATLPLLSSRWRTTLGRRAADGTERDDRARLAGPDAG